MNLGECFMQAEKKIIQINICVPMDGLTGIPNDRMYLSGINIDDRVKFIYKFLRRHPKHGDQMTFSFDPEWAMILYGQN